MWIERLDIQGFGRLAGSFELSPGLTLVVGDNESGKSTLHQALIRALYGFDSGERRQKPNLGRSEKDGYAPWSGTSFGLVALLRDVGGRDLRVEWDFNAHSITARNPDTGEDLSSEFRGKRDAVELGRALLGIGVSEFREVCCLSQTEIQGVTRSDDLVNALQRAVESTAGDVHIEQAVKRLNEFLGKTIGVRADHLMNPLPKGRLRVRLDRKTELELILANTESKRDELATLAAERGDAEHGLTALTAKVQREEQLLLVSRRTALEERARQARDLAATERARPPHSERLTDVAVTAIRSRADRIAELAEQIAALVKQAEAAEPRVTELAAAERALQAAVDGLEVYRGIETFAEADVRGALGQLDALRQPVAEQPQPSPQRDPALARYREERARIATLAAERARSGWNHALAAAAAATAAGSILLGLIVHPALFVALALALALAYRARPRLRDGAGEALQAELTRLGASSLEELDARVSEEDQRMAAAEAVLAERARAEQETGKRRDTLTADLGRLLDEAAAPRAAELEERAAAYLRACEKRAELGTRELELATIRQELTAESAPAKELAGAQRERAEAAKDLQLRLEQLEIDPSEPEAALTELGRLADAAAQADAAGKTLQALLGGETLTQLEARRADAEAAHARHVTVHGQLADKPGDPDEIDRRLTELRIQTAHQSERIAGLAGEVKTREDMLPNPAEIRREIADLEIEIGRLERARAAVDIARQALEEAARETYRSFAPHLRAALERNLPRITSGRYSEAAVDDTLNIVVTAPETGRQISANDLSRGTKDQVFLVERFEIARLLHPKGEAPLLLDDPFARFDPHRLRLGLDLLCEVAADRQVVVFTEDPRIATLAAESCAGCRTIQLPPPPSGPA